jgi:hypothetical protein
MTVGTYGMEWRLVSSSSGTSGGSPHRTASAAAPHHTSSTTGTAAAAATAGTTAAAAAAASSGTAELVVDWPAAVEQCAGDEDFLKELLVDLWNESSEHLEEVSHVYTTYC